MSNPQSIPDEFRIPPTLPKPSKPAARCRSTSTGPRSKAHAAKWASLGILPNRPIETPAGHPEHGHETPQQIAADLQTIAELSRQVAQLAGQVDPMLLIGADLDGSVEYDIDLYLEPWTDIDRAADMLAAWRAGTNQIDITAAQVSA